MLLSFRPAVSEPTLKILRIPSDLMMVKRRLVYGESRKSIKKQTITLQQTNIEVAESERCILK